MGKDLNSIKDYTLLVLFTILIYFTSISPTRHYLEEHEKDVPWHKVVELITTSKRPRKRGKNYEIKKDGYYILFRIEDKTLYVINAKR